MQLRTVPSTRLVERDLVAARNRLEHELLSNHSHCLVDTSRSSAPHPILITGSTPHLRVPECFRIILEAGLASQRVFLSQNSDQADQVKALVRVQCS
jgi:hypothetical protein